MAIHRWQLSLRSLLLLLTLLACCLGMYVVYWERYPLIPAFFTLVMAILSGITWQRKRQRAGLPGALIGGLMGANLAVALHFICGYTMIEYFEDEGLGLWGAVWVFLPYATITGVIAGCLVWAVTYPIFWFLEVRGPADEPGTPDSRGMPHAGSYGGRPTDSPKATAT